MELWVFILNILKVICQVSLITSAFLFELKYLYILDIIVCYFLSLFYTFATFKV